MCWRGSGIYSEPRPAAPAQHSVCAEPFVQQQHDEPRTRLSDQLRGASGVLQCRQARLDQHFGSSGLFGGTPCHNLCWTAVSHTEGEALR